MKGVKIRASHDMFVSASIGDDGIDCSTLHLESIRNTLEALRLQDVCKIKLSGVPCAALSSVHVHVCTTLLCGYARALNAFVRNRRRAADRPDGLRQLLGGSGSIQFLHLMLHVAVNVLCSSKKACQARTSLFSGRKVTEDMRGGLRHVAAPLVWRWC